MTIPAVISGSYKVFEVEKQGKGLEMLYPMAPPKPTRKLPERKADTADTPSTA